MHMIFELPWARVGRSEGNEKASSTTRTLIAINLVSKKFLILFKITLKEYFFSSHGVFGAHMV